MPEDYLNLTCKQSCHIYAILHSGHSQAHIAR